MAFRAHSEENTPTAENQDEYNNNADDSEQPLIGAFRSLWRLGQAGRPGWRWSSLRLILWLRKILLGPSGLADWP